jgi:colanic acid/amylovoran biosynthesis glycosyltransferase
MHVGVVASMKKGLEHFVYRELLTFAGQGYSLSLFPTKFGRGLYEAKEGWRLHRWSVPAVLLSQPRAFLGSPARYLWLLLEALWTRTVVDFLLAWYFAPEMRKVDVIYSTFGDHKFFVGYYCKRILGKPLAVTIHAYELYKNPSPRLFKRALAACDQVITVTEYNRRLLASKFGMDPSRIEVVRISVDVEDYRPEEKFVVLIVAFFAERKGHDTLFEAVRLLGQRDIEVWVVGDEGTERSVDVKGMARRMGIESQVAFFGKVGGNALKALYRECDVFCLPSRTDSSGVAEGFPTVLAEAMAFGKPVISTRHVEIPFVIDEIVVEENDPVAMAGAIRELYQSPEMRERLSKKNRGIAEERFSTRNATRTAKILRCLTGREGAEESPDSGVKTLRDELPEKTGAIQD